MNRRDFVISMFACAAGLSTGSSVAGQKKTGLWVGNNSTGDFANLRIVPA